jgi:hypothetical protein
LIVHVDVPLIDNKNRIGGVIFKDNSNDFCQEDLIEAYSIIAQQGDSSVCS